MVGCCWLVGPWCKVVVAEVVFGRRFVENVLLIRATEGFRKRRVWTEVVLVDASCRRCGFPWATVEMWQGTVWQGLRAISVLVGFP